MQEDKHIDHKNVRRCDSIMKKSERKTGYLLIQLGNAVTWIRNQKLQDKGLTSSQAGIIGFILKHGNQGITPGDVAEGLNLSKATVSEMLKILEKKSFIERYGDATDGRRSKILLTEQGLAWKEYLNNVAAESEKVLLQGMTEEEKTEFNRLLAIALSNINTLKGPDLKGDLR